MFKSFIVRGTVAHEIKIDSAKKDRDQIIAMVNRDHKDFQFDSIEEDGELKDYMGKCTVSGQPIFAGDDYHKHTDGSLTLSQFVGPVKTKK